ANPDARVQRELAACARELGLEVQLNLPRDSRVISLYPVGAHAMGVDAQHMVMAALRRADALKPAAGHEHSGPIINVRSCQMLEGEGGAQTIVWVVDAPSDGWVLNACRLKGSLEGQPITIDVDDPAA